MLADLVEQQTTTVGTGAYTVSGTVLGRRSFTSALTNLSVVPYVVVNDLGDFECGVGTWTTATLSLSRNAITSSSNAGAAVNWTAGTRRIYVSPTAGSLPVPTGMKHRVGFAIGEPTVNEDTLDGYSIGSHWIDESNGRCWICVNEAAGGALWSRVPLKSGDTVFNAYLLDGGTKDNRAWAYYGNTGHSFSGGMITDNSTFWSFADGAVLSMMAKTTNATVTTLALNGNYATNSSIYCEGRSVASLTGTIQAVDSANGDSRVWKVEAVAKTTAAFVTSVVLGAAPTSIYNDAGAAAWTVAVAAAGQQLLVNVTGEAAKTIVWGASLQFGIATHNV